MRRPAASWVIVATAGVVIGCALIVSAWWGLPRWAPRWTLEHAPAALALRAVERMPGPASWHAFVRRFPPEPERPALYLGLLRHRDHQIRFRALTAIVGCAGFAPAWRVEIVACLAHPDAAVRHAAILALAAHGGPADAALVVPLFADPDPEVGAQAVETLSHWGDVRSMPAAFALIARGDGSRAIFCLDRLTDPRCVPAVIDHLAHAHSIVRRQAVRRCWARPTTPDPLTGKPLGPPEFAFVAPELVAPLRRALREDVDEIVRDWAAQALATQGDAAAIPDLRRAAAEDPSARVREAAAAAVAALEAAAR